MMRILFWTLLAILVAAAVRSVLRSLSSSQRAGDQLNQQPQSTGEVEAMARCAHCQVHFPASEAVRADGLDYCSPAHVRLPPL